MITLNVYQKGDATYTTNLAQQFNPAYMCKLKQVSANGDATSTQFLYCGTTYIVSDSITAVRLALTAANTIALAGITEAQLTELVVAFNLANVQSVQDIDGYAGITYAINPDTVGFRATQLAISTQDTDFAGVDSVLATYGFRRIQMDLGDGTSRAMYLNLNAVQTVIGSQSTYFQYVLPNGTIITDTSVNNDYVGNFTGIDADDTFTDIVTDAGTIDMGGVLMITGGERTAIEVLITDFLDSVGATYTSVAATQPTLNTTLRITITNCNVAFNTMTAEIDTVPTTVDFVAS